MKNKIVKVGFLLTVLHGLLLSSPMMHAEYSNAYRVALSDLACKIMTTENAYGSMPGQFGGEGNVGNIVITNDLTVERVIQVKGEYFMLAHDSGANIPDQWNSTRESVAWAEDFVSEVLFYQKPESYTQFNWVMLKVPQGFTNNNGTFGAMTYEGKIIEGGTIAGHLDMNKTFDILLDCTSAEAQSYGFYQKGSEITNLNTYNLANFNYEDGHYCNGNLWDATNPTFLMVPKPLEVATIHWATYDGEKFVIPGGEGANTYGLVGEAIANFTYMQSGSSGDFKKGQTYEFPAIIKTNAEPEDGVIQAAPRRKSSTTLPIIEQHDFYLNSYEVCPLKAPSPVTAVKDVKATAKVVGITYYNLAGMASATPWQGVNIEVQSLDNGTTVTKKFIQ